MRGGAVYHLASRVNHGCFPNVARFDNFDGAFDGGAFGGGGGGSVCGSGSDSPPLPPSELRLVSLDRIPAGEEVLMSYLPVNEPVARRRRRIKRTFGFVCACQRCALEVGWAKEDGGMTGSDEEVVVDRGGGGGGGVDEAAVEAAEAAAEAREEARTAALSEAEHTRRAERIPPEYAMWFARNMVRENTSHAREVLSLYFFPFFSPPCPVQSSNILST